MNEGKTNLEKSGDNNEEYNDGEPEVNNYDDVAFNENFESGYEYPENQDIPYKPEDYEPTNGVFDQNANAMKVNEVTPLSKRDIAVLGQGSPSNSFRNSNMVTMENESLLLDNASAISGITLSTNLENYTKTQLLQKIISMKNAARRDKERDRGDCEDINKHTEGQVIKVTKQDLFKRVQFIRHKNLLSDYSKKGSIGRFVMNKLGIEKNRRKRFWNTYGIVVRKGIKAQRNVIHTNIRRRFLGKIRIF